MSAAPADDVAVRVDGVSKSFRMPTERVSTLKERVLHPARRRRHEMLHALRDVSFDVAGGEVFGVVGRNGSGKSTLMKCLAGIYRSDGGEMWLRGRMAPFIELGVGFNPDLTAHDNVLINAVMLGLTPEQARARYDAVLDFAELHEFAELKLKNYSSGMQVRLAFSVMVHVDADLLLIDEVLAVGDAAFQQKCYDALDGARREGRTILLVTHDMGQVPRFCDRALLLDRGRVVAIGNSTEVADRYIELNFATVAGGLAQPDLPAAADDDGAHIVDAWIQNVEGRAEVVAQGSSCALFMRVRFTRPARDPTFGFSMTDAQGHRVFVASSVREQPSSGRFEPGEEALVGASFDNWLAPGRYELGARVSHAGTGDRIIASQEPAGSVVVTSAHHGGGLVDIPNAFHITRVPAESAAQRTA